jgi:hypothetical protein
MIEVKAWLIGLLLLSLPADWTQTRSQCGPAAHTAAQGAAAIEECHAVWTRGEQDIYAFVWTPFPPRDGGAMVAAEEWPVTFLNQPAKIVRTKMFLGMEQQVLVATAHVETPAANVMVYARGLSLDEFRTLIEGAKRTTSGLLPQDSGRSD